MDLEKDLGILFDSNLNFKEHILAKINLARRNLGLIKHTFKYIDESTFLTLYKSLVRPHLEYCSPVWNTNLKGFSKNIEKIQKSATRIVPSLKNLSYSERLKIKSCFP